MIDDLAREPRFAHDIAVETGVRRPRRCTASPITVAGTVVGVLSVLDAGDAAARRRRRPCSRRSARTPRPRSRSATRSATAAADTGRGTALGTLGGVARADARHRPAIGGCGARSYHLTRHGQGADPDLAPAALRHRRAARRRAGRAPARHARRQPDAPDDERAQEALARRQLETAEQIVAALGTMKGAAMKLGQVMSFLDVGLVPERVPRAVPGQARRAARRRAEGRLQGHEEGHRAGVRRADRGGLRDLRPGADRRRLDRPGLPARGSTTGATSRSRSSTRASARPCGPTCRTSG